MNSGGVPTQSTHHMSHAVVETALYRAVMVIITVVAFFFAENTAVALGIGSNRT